MGHKSSQLSDFISPTAVNFPIFLSPPPFPLMFGRSFFELLGVDGLETEATHLSLFDSPSYSAGNLQGMGREQKRDSSATVLV